MEKSAEPKTLPKINSKALTQIKCDVLVIEDEPLMTALMKRYLRGLAVEKITKLNAPTLALNVQTLESGFELLRSDLSQVKVVVVDLLLPKVTGVDLIRDFRNRFPNLGIVAVSGMATEAMLRDLHELLKGDFRFLSKPLRKDDFFEAFNQAWEYQDQGKGLLQAAASNTAPSSSHSNGANAEESEAGEGIEALWYTPKAAVGSPPVVEKRVNLIKKIAA